MKRGPILMVTALFLTALSIPAWAFDKTTRMGEPKAAPSSSRISMGVRLMDEFPGLKDFPVEKDDLAYELFYEYHEGIGLWQIGAAYIPDGDERFDYLVTPQVNLIFKDRIYRLGSGVLKSCVATEDGEDWTDLYWQVIAGLGFTFGDFIGLDISAHYVFKKWKDIADTDKAAVDYSARLSLSF